MQEITVHAPTRIDLAGGTLDLWPIHQLLPYKSTVNVALNLRASTTLRLGALGEPSSLHSSDQQLRCSGSFAELSFFASPPQAAAILPLHRLMLRNLWTAELPPLALSSTCTSPQGAGLGGSSSLAITLASALGRARKLLDGTPQVAGAALVAQAQDIEAHCLHTPTGIQDYWAAVNGGITHISYPPGAPLIRCYPLAQLPELQDEVLICYSGRSRLSGINNWQIFKGMMEGNGVISKLIEEIGYHSEAVSQALLRGGWQELLGHSHKEWQARRQLGAGIETEETQRIDQAAGRAGAYFTRICGAGGGGVMALFVPKEKRQQVAAAAEAAGGVILSAGFTEQGVSI